MSLNNFVRTQNYRLTISQLNSANSRISELESQVQGLQQLEDKAEGFELLAEKDGLKNTVKTLKVYVEIGATAEVSPVFDNKSTTKAIKLSGISFKEGSEADKFVPVVKFEDTQTVSTAAGVELCQLREVEFDEVSVVPASSDSWECGDLVKCENIKVPETSAVGVSELAVDSPFVKQDNLDAPLGLLSTNSAVFTVSCVEGDSKFYVLVEAPADTFVASPIPAKKSEA